MSPRTLTTINVMTAISAAALLLVSAPHAAAQERGTIEFGGFASYSSFDDDLLMDNAWGAGIRVGAFIFPRLSVEFDLGQKQADRPDGLESVDVEAFAARLTAVPVVVGPVSVLLGAGVSHTDWQNDVSDGFQGLVGLKVDLGNSAALRVDGVMDWNDDEIRNQTLQMGLSLYRHPGPRAGQPARATPTRTAPQDSVSAAETRRLRAVESRYEDLRDSHAELRDSLAELRASLADMSSPTLSAAQRATMTETIYFQHDQSALSDEATSILRAKVPVFRANPTVRIVIMGYASAPGTQAYNLALGLRRADAARDYLVSQGIARSRIDIATRGEGDQLAVEGPDDVVEARNRRAEFQILMAEPGGLQD